MLRIVDARWTPKGNVLVIECDFCDAASGGRYVRAADAPALRFDHPADRWWAKCPGCGIVEGLGKLRAAVTWK